MSIELEILEHSYWEHYKRAKDLSLVLPLDHPKRIALSSTLKIINKQIHKIKKDKS